MFTLYTSSCIISLHSLEIMVNSVSTKMICEYILWFPFYRQVNWGLALLSNLGKVTNSGKKLNGIGLWNLHCWMSPSFCVLPCDGGPKSSWNDGRTRDQTFMEDPKCCEYLYCRQFLDMSHILILFQLCFYSFAKDSSFTNQPMNGLIWGLKKPTFRNSRSTWAYTPYSKMLISLAY